MIQVGAYKIGKESLEIKFVFEKSGNQNPDGVGGLHICDTFACLSYTCTLKKR